MMREWVGHLLKERGMARARFVTSLDLIILNQIKRLLTKREMPSIIRKDTAQEGYRAPFDGHPLLGHIAIYSLNLVLLRVIVSDGPFVFDEGKIGTHEDGARPWDRLTHIWRSWFSLDNLNGVTAVLQANRAGGQVTVRAKDKFQAESESRLETCRSVAVALGDGVASGLAGLLLFDSSKGSSLELQDVQHRLDAENINLGLQIGMKRLFLSYREFTDSDAHDFALTARDTLEMALHQARNDDLEYICTGLRQGLRRRKLGGSGSVVIREIFGRALSPEFAAEIAARRPRAGLILWDLAKEMSEGEWRHRFARHLIEEGFHRRHDPMTFERDPDTWIARLQLIRELGAERSVDPKFFERMFDPRLLLELSEVSPESALAMLQLVRQFGGEGFLRRYGERALGPEFVDQMLHPGRLLEMIKERPESALAILQLLRELGGDHLVERHSRELLDSKGFGRTFTPQRLLELSNRDPEAALATLRLMRELGDERRTSDFVNSEFVERALNPQMLLELSDVNPDAALAMLQLMGEFAGDRSRDDRGRAILRPEFLERALDPRRLFALSERSPELALGILQLVRRFAGTGLLAHYDKEMFHPEFFRIALDPYRLSELGERNPMAALVMVQVMREFGLAHARDYLSLERFEAFFGSSWGTRLLREKPAVLAVILRLVNGSQQHDVLHLVLKSVSSALLSPGGGLLLLEQLPMSSIPDLQWFAKASEYENRAGSLVQGWLHSNGITQLM
jgi:hypothetical protein